MPEEKRCGGGCCPVPHNCFEFENVLADWCGGIKSYAVFRVELPELVCEIVLRLGLIIIAGRVVALHHFTRRLDECLVLCGELPRSAGLIGKAAEPRPCLLVTVKLGLGLRIR